MIYKIRILNALTNNAHFTKTQLISMCKGAYKRINDSYDELILMGLIKEKECLNKIQGKNPLVINITKKGLKSIENIKYLK